MGQCRETDAPHYATRCRLTSPFNRQASVVNTTDGADPTNGTEPVRKIIPVMKGTRLRRGVVGFGGIENWSRRRAVEVVANAAGERGVWRGAGLASRRGGARTRPRAASLRLGWLLYIRRLLVCAGWLKASRIPPACGLEMESRVGVVRWFSLGKPRFTTG
jgi:hypothetical protein